MALTLAKHNNSKHMLTQPPYLWLTVSHCLRKAGNPKVSIVLSTSKCQGFALTLARFVRVESVRVAKKPTGKSSIQVLIGSSLVNLVAM